MENTMSTTTSADRTDAVTQRPKISLIAFFILVTFASWLGVLPRLIESWRPGTLPAGSGLILQLPMFFAPALVTILVSWWNDGAAGVRKLLGGLLAWRVGFRWYAFIFLAPAMLYLLALQSSTWFGGRVVPLQAPLDLLTTFGISFATWFFLNTEEVAWRGYALPRLLARTSPGRASLILGVIWGLFHVPVFLLKGGHPAGISLPLFLVLNLALAVVFTWLMQHTRGSLLVAHLFHLSFNGWVEVIPLYPQATGSHGPFLVVTGILAAAALFIRWQWSRSYETQDESAGAMRGRLVAARGSAIAEHVQDG
jgi:CAAX protease family protein